VSPTLSIELEEGLADFNRFIRIFLIQMTTVQWLLKFSPTWGNQNKQNITFLS